MRTKIIKLWSWIKFSRKHQAIAGFVGIILLCSGVTLASALISDPTGVPVRTPTIKSTDSTTLSIESNIPGITMTGEPFCDSTEIKKVTPYECKFEEGQKETVISAPMEFTINNEKYVFQTWDGCSASNVDKRICKVVLEPAETKKITAGYSKSTSKSVSDGGQSSSRAVENSTVTEEYRSYSAPGCPAAPDILQNRYQLSGSQVFCIVGIDIPAGSNLVFKNFNISPTPTLPGLYGLDTSTIFATCYIDQKIATDACVRSATNEYASVGNPLNIQRGNNLDVLKQSTLVVSNAYKTETYSGLSRVPSGIFYIFNSWDITKTENSNGTFTYSVTTNRILAQ